MDHDKKYKSEFDKKFASEIAEPFNIEYAEWLSRIQSESSSKRGKRFTNADSSANRSNRSSSISEARRPKANCKETSSELPGHQIHGFENEILFLKSLLLKQKESKEFKALAIVGKFGVGKTTLCKAVFNEEAVKEAYLPRIWVSMYKEAKEDEDPKIAIAKRILLSLGVEDETLEHIKTEAVEEKNIKAEAGKTEEETVKEKELSTLLHTLNSILTDKKYLIVFDDVWEDNEWDQRLDDEKKQQERCHLSCGFPKGFGGRVIVTSRDEKLAKKIVGEEENLIRLFPRLDEESVFEIYRDAIGREKEVKPRYPGRFKQELMDKSCGLPWAARNLNEPVKSDESEEDLERKKSF